MSEDLSDNIDVLQIVSIARSAGDVVMQIYNDVSCASEFQMKADRSPLTKADTASHEHILHHLNELSPSIPVLSEENSEHIHFDNRKYWQNYWLVDPLDGTKEFLKRNGEFTINIALMQHNEPVLGVVYVPCRDLTYYATKACGAYKVEHAKTYKLPLQQQRDHTDIVAVVSKSHHSELLTDFLENMQKTQGRAIKSINMGSSLKFCLVAEGAADIYPRFVPTMEWDTAAADVIIRESGKNVLNAATNKPLIYNKSNLLNPFFIAS